MKINRIALHALTVAGIWAASQAQAVVVDFTSPDYTDGNLPNNAAWNEDANVNNHGDNIVVTAGTGYNGASGIVNMDPVGNWTDHILNTGFVVAGEDDTLTITSRFQYDTSAATPAGWLNGIYGLIMFATPTGGDNMRVMVQRMGNGNIELILFSNGPGSGPYPYTGAVAEVATGVTSAIDTSDWLELSLRVTRGSDLSNWKMSVSLHNLNTDTPVVAEQTYQIEAPSIFSTDTFYAALSSVNPAQANVSQVRVDTFEATTVTPIYPTDIISGSLGNGDFQANDPSGVNALPYSDTPNWYVAGQVQTFNFSFTNGAPTRAAMTWKDRLNVNDTGWTVQAAGEVFNLDYTFYRFGNPYTDDELNRTWLFTVRNGDPVDENLSGTNMQVVPGSENFYAVNTNATTHYTQPVSHKAFYITTAADIGKTFYLATQFRNPDGLGSNQPAPRIDNVSLTVREPRPSVDIISGPLGNGDFQANDPAGVNSLPYSDTPNWHLAGQAETFQFTFTNGAPTRAGMTWKDRMNVNDTGWTVQAAGEVFNLAYTFFRFGNPYTNDETNRTWLFTTQNGAPVDDDLSGTDMQTVAGSEYLYVVNTNQLTHYSQAVIAPAFYTTTAADIGKTFYLASQFKNPDGLGNNQPAPRIDNVRLTVETVVDPLLGWAKFIADYGLTENKTDNADTDDLNNWGEYVFGGDPTNSADIGTQPDLDVVLGAYNVSLIGDNTVTARVFTATSLSPANWTPRDIFVPTVNNGLLGSYTSFVGTVPNTQFIKLEID